MISLFFGIIFVTFIRAFLPKIASFAFQIFSKNYYNEVISKQMELENMVAELDQISMTDEWPRYVKLQRRINKAKADLGLTRKDLAEEKERSLASIMKVINGAIFVCILMTLFYDRSVVVAQIPEDWLGWPLSRLLFWSSNVSGGITMPCWMILSSRVAQSFASEMT